MPYIRISRLGDCSYLWHHNENIAEKYMPVKPSPRTKAILNGIYPKNNVAHRPMCD